jgi:superfamily II DNA or RNA helicase
VEITLRDYQKESVDRFFDRLNHHVKRQLIVLPPAAGKTIIAAAISKQYFHQVNDKAPILFLAHRDEILKQTERKIKYVWEEVSIGRVKGKENNQNATVILASTQTLIRGRDIIRPSLIIYDEAQHALSKGSQQLLMELGCFQADGPPLIGITATPYRSDHMGLGDVFQEIVYKKTIMDLILAGYLCEIRGKKVVVKDLHFTNMPVENGDFDQNYLGEVMSDNHVVQTVVKAYLEQASHLKTIVFAVNKKQTYEIVEQMKRQGIKVTGIDSSIPENKRAEILKQFEKGEYRVLVNCSLLIEGYDQPDVSCVLIARPTRSKSLYTQMVGRGLRLHPSKEFCLILDVVGSLEDSKLITSYDLFQTQEKEPSKKRNQSYVRRKNIDFVQNVEAVTDPIVTYDELKLLHYNSRYRWIKLSDQSYFLSIGGKKAVYLIEEDSGRWWSLFENDDKRIFPLYHDSLAIEYAQGIAEVFVKEIESPLITMDAKWRQQPISPTQKKLLRKYNLKFDSNWTKGEAADMLVLYFGKQEAQKVLKRFSPIHYRKIMDNDLLRAQLTQQLEEIKKNMKKVND